jgi:hypothetical protein
MGLILRILGIALLGGVAAMLGTGLAALLLAHMLNPACGTPGDSGGCEMSAVALGMAATLPGALIGAGLAVWRARRR